jgi:hypothetical protein
MENSPIKKILIMEKYGNYCLAQKDKNGLNLELNEHRIPHLINAKHVVPYGLPFTFGPDGQKHFRTLSYLNPSCHKKEFEKRLEDNPLPEDFGRINLDITIEGLENKVKENGADFIYVDNLVSKNAGTYWEISGRAQLLLTTKFSEE